jgi:hypothetical protein
MALFCGYLLALGADASYESHPAALAFMMKALPYLAPLALAFVAYHVVQAVRAFREGAQEARKHGPANTPPPQNRSLSRWP